MYNKLFKFFGFLDLPSGIIVGLWSIAMLIGSVYSIWTTKQITMPVAMMFSTVITGFAGHKIVTIWKGQDQKTQDKNLDIQGD